MPFIRLLLVTYCTALAKPAVLRHILEAADRGLTAVLVRLTALTRLKRAHQAASNQWYPALPLPCRPEVPSTRTVYVSPSLISAEEKITLLIEPRAVAVQRVLPEESCTVMTLPLLDAEGASRFGRLPDGLPSALPPEGLVGGVNVPSVEVLPEKFGGVGRLPSVVPFASPGGVVPLTAALSVRAAAHAAGRRGLTDCDIRLRAGCRLHARAEQRAAGQRERAVIVNRRVHHGIPRRRPPPCRRSC